MKRTLVALVAGKVGEERLHRALDLGIVDGERVDARIAFVGNNDYNLELFSIGERERLDEGRLHVYLARGWRPGYPTRCCVTGAERLTAAQRTLVRAAFGRPVADDAIGDAHAAAVCVLGQRLSIGT